MDSPDKLPARDKLPVASAPSTAEQAQEVIPDPLEALRKQFDQRLAGLKGDDAGARLRALMKAPGKLNGRVKAGSSY
jgi:hypothetical protein